MGSQSAGAARAAASICLGDASGFVWTEHRPRGWRWGEAEHGALRRGRRRATLIWSALCPSDSGKHWPFLSREMTPFVCASANPSESNTKNWQKWSLEAGQLSKGYYSNPDGKLEHLSWGCGLLSVRGKTRDRPQTWSWRDWMQVPREKRIKGSASEKNWEFTDTLWIQSLAKNELVYKARFPPGLLVTWSKIK